MKTDMPNPSRIDWARLAAFIDGEGCIFIAKRSDKGCTKVRTYLYIVIANTNPKLGKWLTESFGGSVLVQRHKNSKYSLAYRWTVCNNRAQWILKGCYKFLLLKQDQADVGLAHQRLCARIKKGQTKHPSEVFEERFKLRDALSMLKSTSSRRRDLPITTAVQ